MWMRGSVWIDPDLTEAAKALVPAQSPATLATTARSSGGNAELTGTPSWAPNGAEKSVAVTVGTSRLREISRNAAKRSHPGHSAGVRIDTDRVRGACRPCAATSPATR